jgi:hypothetical protein
MGLATMKSFSLAVFALIVLTLAASIDNIPDPPAISPHSVDVQASCLREFTGVLRAQLPALYAIRLSPRVPIHRVSPADPVKPKRSSDWIRLAGYASDPSPPVV